MADCFVCNSVRVMHVSVLSAFSFAALTCVVFRLSARRIQGVKLELNDYLCIVGLVCSWPFQNSPNADRTLGLHLSNNTLHNAFHHIPGPRPSQPQRKLGRQSAARRTVTLGHIRDFHPGLCPGSLYPNLPDADFSYSLLRGPRFESSLLYLRRPSLLLDMSAFRVSLGSVHRWLLRRSKVSRSFHRSVQPLNGRHDCCAPNARSVGSPSAIEAESDHNRDVLYGSSVSNPQQKVEERQNPR